MSLPEEIVAIQARPQEVELEQESRTACTTITLRSLDLLDPQPEDINIMDIATGLAFTCRYGGQVPFHYSVAQHSIGVAGYCKEEYRLWGLMHDAAEAYIGDIRKPYKPLIANFEELEERVLRVIADKFNLKWHEDGEQHGVPDVVKKIDNRILYSEARQLLPGAEWCKYDAKIPTSAGYPDFSIQPTHPEQAKQAFLQVFSELYYKR